MHAVILAGGKGVRLRPYTTAIPKPLVPIGDENCILDIVLQQLAARGFTGITLAIGHFGHLIRSFVGGGSRWGLAVDYVDEDQPLGTIGPLLPVLDRLPDHFLVMNGDVLTDLAFDDLLSGHVASGAGLTVATFARKVHIDFGVLDISEGQVAAFREKPTLPFRVSMGVYGVSRETLRPYTPGRPFGFDELVLDLLDRGTPPRTYPFDGYWLDIGRPEDYDRANLDFEVLRSAFLPATTPDRPAPPSGAGGIGAEVVRLPSARRRPDADGSASRDRHRIMVIGATGFLGRHVVSELRERTDAEVTALALDDDGTLGVPTVQMDVVGADEQALRRLLQGLSPTTVVNCAGTTSGSFGELARGNVVLVGNLLEAIARSGTGARLVHIGSSAEYGPGVPGVAVDEAAVPRPTSSYAVTKLAGTEAVLAAAASRRVAGVVLRVFNPIGPGAPGTSLTGRVLAELDRALSNGGGPLRLGPLDAARDFVDVRDVAGAVVRAATLAGDLTGVFNVGHGQAVSVRHLVAALCREAGYFGDVVERAEPSARSAQVDWQCADISRARRTLDWYPAFELEDSVRTILGAGVTL